MGQVTGYMITGAAAITVATAEVASINDKGIKLELKAKYDELGNNNAYPGATDVMQHLGDGIVEFETEEMNVKKISTALGACSAYEENTTSPNYCYINLGYNKLTAVAIVISTVGPLYTGSNYSTRTITIQRAVPTPETYDLLMGIGLKPVVKMRFKILKASSGQDITIIDTWT